MKKTLIAAAVFGLFASGLTHAQTPAAPAAANADRPATTAPMTRATGEMRRDRSAEFKNEKEMLEGKLQAATARADYAKILEQNGYRVSSINADKPDYVEYEIVKGDHSYEVQLDFKDNAPKATKVDVTTNMWRTDATKKMLADANYKQAGPMVAGADDKYSERRYMKGWTDEKDQLEKSLQSSMKAGDVEAKLKSMGYKITSVNDKEADYAEYEIVKGDHSYEVQVDLDPKTKMTKKVDVTTNVWEADATERAKGDKMAAADRPAGMAPTTPGMTAPAAGMAAPAANMMNRRDRLKNNQAAYNTEVGKLELMLKGAQNRADYRSIIEKDGYRISAINADKPDYIEYEIVKGVHTYEVHLDFKDNATKATKVDVAPNMWRAESTERMMKDENYKHAGPMVADTEGRYSDRRYAKGWADDKEKLEKAMPPGMKAADLKAKIEQMGYKITSVNDREKDYLEYEIVKGDNSYEVQVDMDPKTSLSKEVDVTSNIWETDATERAKDEQTGKRSMTAPVVAAAGTMAAAPAAVMASGASPTRPMTSGPMLTPRRDRSAEFKNEKEMLEGKLQAATARADYAKILEQNGYRVSSINADKPDYVEYEIVKGDHSYEVQLDFKDNAPKATKVDVTTNMWRTDATKKMLADANYKQAGPMVAGADDKYSERRYMKGWTDEKDQLEKSLQSSMKAGDVEAKLKSMGYKITSVNDKEADYAEYEIVKGDHSYEVQVDLDPKTKMTKKVDVTTNVWEADVHRARQRGQANGASEVNGRPAALSRTSADCEVSGPVFSRKKPRSCVAFFFCTEMSIISRLRRPTPKYAADCNPDRYHEQQPDAADRLGLLRCPPCICLCAAGVEQRRRYQSDRQPDQTRQQDQFVEQSEHRDEVGNQVDRAQRIRHHDQAERLGTPGYFGMAGGKPQRNRIAP